MNYDITKHTAPKMPTLGNGTECILLLLSQASKDMHEPLVPMLFPPLGAHMSGSEFQYPDLTWKEPCGQMANLVSDTGGNKGQLSLLVEAERGNCHSSSRPKGALDIETSRLQDIETSRLSDPQPAPAQEQKDTFSLPSPCRAGRGTEKVGRR